jgi:hypothetical protein
MPPCQIEANHISDRSAIVVGACLRLNSKFLAGAITMAAGEDLTFIENYGLAQPICANISHELLEFRSVEGWKAVSNEVCC